MAYSSHDLKEIIVAERQFWEAASREMVRSVDEHIFHGFIIWRIDEELVDISRDSEARQKWIDNRIRLVLEIWRKNFAPLRAGLPLESEWKEGEEKEG